jgi:SprT-like family
MYQSTYEKLYNYVYILNELIFDNQICVDDIEFEIEETQDCWGWCVPHEEKWNKIILGVTTEFEDKYFFIQTILHEMIHAYQISNDLEVGHEETESWRLWANTIISSIGMEL